MVLSFWCGSWPFLLVVGVWAFLPGVRAGPPFSGFGLARVTHGGGLFLLTVGVRPPFWEWWLAHGDGFGPQEFTFLAVEEVRHAFSERGLGPSWTWPLE